MTDLTERLRRDCRPPVALCRAIDQLEQRRVDAAFERAGRKVQRLEAERDAHERGEAGAA